MNTENEKQPDELNTKDYFIAYLDILGYQGKLIQEEKNNDNEFLNTINLSVKMADFFAFSLSENLKDKNKNAVIIKRIFTDNFFYCTEKDYQVLLDLVSSLQAMFIHRNIFIRGALYYGKLYIDDNFIYGSSIVNAYEIESKIAIFPRVIIDDTFFNGILSIETANGKNDLTFDKIIAYFNAHYYDTDIDNNKFVDYLGVLKNALDKPYSGEKTYDFNTLIKDHAYYITENLKTDNKSVAQKYQWCKTYHNIFCIKNGYNDLVIS